MRIIGQPINVRNIAKLKLAPQEVTESWKLINKIVEVGLTHGYRVAIDVYNISKSTYYNYVRMYKTWIETGKEVKFKSKRPLHGRIRNWDKRIIRFIQTMRANYPNIGKSKIKAYLDEYCVKENIKVISTGTIQNIINSFQNKLRTNKVATIVRHRSNVLRKPSNYKPKKSGECVSLDSMEFRQDGQTLYIVVTNDESSNLLYAEATRSHTSRATKQILENALDYLPWNKFTTILTDNGSEFGKEFAQHLKENNITHYHTYPKSPKQNARCERVNRTIQDEFMIKYGNLLFHDIHLFNQKLRKYLYWFNFKRVHQRFGNKHAPFQQHLLLQQQGLITC